MIFLNLLQLNLYNRLRQGPVWLFFGTRKHCCPQGPSWSTWRLQGPSGSTWVLQGPDRFTWRRQAPRWSTWGRQNPSRYTSGRQGPGRFTRRRQGQGWFIWRRQDQRWSTWRHHRQGCRRQSALPWWSSWGHSSLSQALQPRQRLINNLFRVSKTSSNVRLLVYIKLVNAYIETINQFYRIKKPISPSSGIKPFIFQIQDCSFYTFSFSDLLVDVGWVDPIALLVGASWPGKLGQQVLQWIMWMNHPCARKRNRVRVIDR